MREGVHLLMGGGIYPSSNYETYCFFHVQAFDVMKFKIPKSEYLREKKFLKRKHFFFLFQKSSFLDLKNKIVNIDHNL